MTEKTQKLFKIKCIKENYFLTQTVIFNPYNIVE